MLLSIQNLQVAFRMGKVAGEMQRTLAVKGVSFDVPENSTVALVGESGSGKSVTAMSILNLLPDNAERSGVIEFQGRDLLKASLRDLQGLRGREIACVFQDPMSSLNPVFNVAQQIMEPLIKHMKMSRRQALTRAEALLNEVGIPEPKRRLTAYPHELSGGQQQRVAIARALAMEPKLILLDEPTSALDPEMINEVLEVMVDLANEGMTMIVVTHEMGFARKAADRVIFMADGEIVEETSPEEFFTNPQSTRAQDFLSKILDH